MHNIASIKEIFETDPNLANVRKIVKQSEVIEKFYEIFPNLEKNVFPQKVEKKNLLLKVENPALRSELKFNEELFLKKINKFFHEERVTSVRFI
jgi:Dna[CI] antecedent, DciA